MIYFLNQKILRNQELLTDYLFINYVQDADRINSQKNLFTFQRTQFITSRAKKEIMKEIKDARINY
jgi:hypothetical protein